METQFTINLDSLKPSELEAIAAGLQLAALAANSEDFTNIWRMYSEVKFAGISNEGEQDFFMGVSKAQAAIFEQTRIS